MKNIIYILRVTAVLLMLGCIGLPLHAQTERNIRVADGRSFTEHISMKVDSRDMDIMAKFIFNEQENTLTVSLMSYRSLFGFDDDVRYKQVVSCSRLRPDRLPYVLDYDQTADYRMSSELKEQLSPHKRQHVFKRWIAYEGLQPKPVPPSVHSDFLERKFDILNKETVVTVTLNDILVMDTVDQMKRDFEFVYLARLDRVYTVRIDRNPCFGKDEEIQASQQQVEAVKQAYEVYRDNYELLDRNVPENLQILKDMQAILLEQFPRKEEGNECPAVDSNMAAYNTFVDRIGSFDLTLAEPDLTALPVTAEYILEVARTIDKCVTRWMVTEDVVEKRDLAKRAGNLADKLNHELAGPYVPDSRQQSAIAVYRKAEGYYKRTCLKKDK